MKVTVLLIILGLFLTGCQVDGEPGLPPTGNEEEMLVNTSWILEEIQGQQALPGTTITLQFDSNNLAGNAGCNSYSGSYEITGVNITIPEIIATEMACLEPQGVMEQEQLYLQTLRGTSQLQIMDDRLEMEDEPGIPALVFRRE